MAERKIDYTGNTHKEKEKKEKPDLPEKKIEKVVVHDVIIQKKSLGRKFRDMLIKAQFRSVLSYLGHEVFEPAVRAMFFDALTKGGERVIWPDSGARRRYPGPPGSSRVTYTSYNNPINRAPQSSERIRYGPVAALPRGARVRTDDVILASREEAERVLESMQDIIDVYEVVSVADLYELVGLQTSYTDNKFGWSHVGNVEIRGIREGWLIDLPQAEPIA